MNIFSKPLLIFLLPVTYYVSASLSSNLISAQGLPLEEMNQSSHGGQDAHPRHLLQLLETSPDLQSNVEQIPHQMGRSDVMPPSLDLHIGQSTNQIFYKLMSEMF